MRIEIKASQRKKLYSDCGIAKQIFVAYLSGVIEHGWLLPVIGAFVVSDRRLVEKLSNIVLVAFKGIEYVFKVHMVGYDSAVHIGAIASCFRLVPVAVSVGHFVEDFDVIVVIDVFRHAVDAVRSPGLESG